MTSLLSLESFDTDVAVNVADTSGPPPTYEDGYEAGLADAKAMYEAEQATLQAAVVQSIGDAAFGYHEAQASMLASVQPLLTAMLSVFLPEALAPALHVRLKEIVLAAGASDLQGPMLLSLPPAQLGAVRQALADIDTSFVTFQADPNLTDHAAWVSVEKHETALDLDAALAVLKDRCAAISESVEEAS